ncbi:MAG: hypothetical protein EOM66_03645 [Clostridia bacterium]|nr:hypothetical protein [Clostridia bacterium]
MTETVQSNFHLNGTAYVATLSVNGLPMEGSLARLDASTGWRFLIQGKQTEEAELAGVPLKRTWEISLDLAKTGLTVDPNGIYRGKASISLHYDMEPFDKAVFEIAKDLRGNGTDFDYTKIKGWFSHDEYAPSKLDQRWESEDFPLYIGGLGEAGASVVKTLGHTLSYLPQERNLHLSHKLFYDMPQNGETYIYTMQADESEEAALLRLYQYKGKAKKSLSAKPVEQFDLSEALNALDNTYILLAISAK